MSSSSTTSSRAISELLRRNEDLSALVSSLHDIERAEESRAHPDSLTARLNRWWARPSPRGLVAALLGAGSTPPAVRLVADARVAAPLPSARLPSYFSRTSEWPRSPAAAAAMMGTGKEEANDGSQNDQDEARVVSAPGVAASVTAGVVLLITQVQPGGVVTRRAMSIAVVGGAMAGVGLFIVRRLAQLAAAGAAGVAVRRGGGAARRYDAKHEYECRVQELKFRYEKMARTLRALRADARIMAHQREELYDLTALLARHDALVRHAFLAIGIRPADADAILSPLRAQLRAFGSRTKRADSLTRTHGADDDDDFSGSVDDEATNVSVGVGKLSGGRNVVVSVGEQRGTALSKKATPRTEIVLRGVGNVSERKMRRMQQAVAQIFAESDDDDDDADAVATPPMLLPPGRRRGDSAQQQQQQQRRRHDSDSDADETEDDSFFSADENDFVQRNAPFESSLDSATRSDVYTDDDEPPAGAKAHDLRSQVLVQQQQRAALTPPQSRRRPTRSDQAPDFESPGFYKWAPQATSAAAAAAAAVAASPAATPAPAAQRKRAATLFETAMSAGDGVFVYKFRHAESGVSDVKLYRAQVFWLRRAFESLSTEHEAMRADLMQLSEQLAVSLLSDVLGDRAAADSFRSALRELMAWVGANAEQARLDAARLKCRHLNAYDAFLEWILLDAFADLANVPSALSGWMPEAGKRALVVRQLDGKIAAARAANNEFQSRYYTALKALTPHLVVGFTSNNKAVQKVFTALQRIVIERLYRPLFAIDIRALRDERLFIERALETTRAALLEIRQAVDAGSNVS